MYFTDVENQRILPDMRWSLQSPCFADMFSEQNNSDSGHEG